MTEDQEHISGNGAASTDSSQLVAFEGEVALLDWSSSPQGHRVTLLLEADAESNPFSKFYVRSAHAVGHRFYMRAIELDDDDGAVNQVDRAAAKEVQKQTRRRNGWTRANEAARLARDLDFQRFVWSRLFSEGPDPTKSKAFGILPEANQTQVESQKAACMKDKAVAVSICEGLIYGACSIDSRKQLDSDHAKAARFDRMVAEPFHVWKVARERRLREQAKASA